MTFLGTSSLGDALIDATLRLFIALLPFLTISLASPGWQGLFFPWGILLLLEFLMLLSKRNHPDVQAYAGPPLQRGAGLLLFWLAFMVSALFARGFSVNYFQIGLITIQLLCGWLLSMALSRDRSLSLMKLMLFSSLLWMIIGSRQLGGAQTPPGWLGGMQSQVIPVRIYAVFANPNVFALYLLMVLSWAHYLGQAAPLNWQKIWYHLFEILMLAALYFTYSRTAWFITALFLIFWYGLRVVPSQKRVLIISGCLLLLGLLLPDFRIRVLSLANDTSVWQRPLIWKAVWRLIGEHWLWGTGPGTFSVVFPEYGGMAAWAAHAHQQYLQIWLENGLLTLIAFGMVIKRTVPGFLKGDKAERAIGMALVGFLIAGLTDTWSASPFLGGIFWVMIGVGKALRETDVRENGAASPKLGQLNAGAE